MQDPLQCTWEKVLTPDESRLLWDSWDASRDTCPYKNKMVSGSWHVCVPTKLTCVMTSEVFRQNSVEGLLKKMKKPSEEELRKEMGRVTMNLGTFGGEQVGIDDVGAAMLGGGGIRAGQGLGMSIGDVTNLIRPEADAEDAAVEEDNSEDDDDEGDGKGGGNGGSKKETWWNKASFQSGREHDVQSMIDLTQKELLEQSAKLKKVAEDTCVV